MVEGFSPRFPWYGGDLQTVRNYLVPPRNALARWPGKRVEFDGGERAADRLLGSFHVPDDTAGRPLVVLIHGLTGCEGSFYLLETARYLLSAGYPVLRFNLRGAGPSRATCAGHYSAASSPDLATVLAQIDGAMAEFASTADRIALVGYSLGGSILLKHLVERVDVGSLVGAVTVSAPLDLAAAAQRMMRPRNTLYHRWLLARMKSEALDGAAVVSAAERRAIDAARTIFDYDDRFVAPRFGFDGAQDYYARCSAAGMLHRIEVPTLLVHARDDPWIPPGAYDEMLARMPPGLTVELPGSGGHVGFHGRNRETPWHNLRLGTFIEHCHAAGGRAGAAGKTARDGRS